LTELPDPAAVVVSLAGVSDITLVVPISFPPSDPKAVEAIPLNVVKGEDFVAPATRAKRSKYRRVAVMMSSTGDVKTPEGLALPESVNNECLESCGSWAADHASHL
jgi:hypothetical protein